jgi:chromosome segregation ATPase
VTQDGTAAGGYPAAPANPVAERMQALLSRAVEEQVSEQRSVSNALAEVRAQVAAVGEGLRGAASGVAVERLRSDLSALGTELRMSTTGVSERFDVLARRIDEQAAAIAAAGGGSTQIASHLEGVASEVAAQGAAVQRLSAAVAALSAFPEALAALQKDVSGLHDRLSPLADVRAAVGDLQARSSAAEAVRPELEALSGKVEALATAADMARLRDSVVSSLGERIDGLAASPAVTPEHLTEALTPLQNRLSVLASGGPALERVTALEARLQSLEALLTSHGERLGAVGDAVGGIPAVATDLHRQAEQVDSLGSELAAVREQLTHLSGSIGEVAQLRSSVDTLTGTVSALDVPSNDEVAAAVSARLADRLVDQLAPRVADAVLHRIGPIVAEQVGAAVSDRVMGGVETSTAAAEVRLRTHMDEAILTLAEALLRKRRPNRSWAPEVVVDDDEGAPPAPLPVPTPTPPSAAPAPEPAVAEDAAPADADVEELRTADDGTSAAEAIEPAAPTRTEAGPRPAPRLPRSSVLPAESTGRPRGISPAGAAEPHEDDDDEDDEEDGRRRPWWRPGG